MKYLSKQLMSLKESRSFLTIIAASLLISGICPIQAQDEEEEDLKFYELATFEVDPGFAGSLAFSTEAKRRAPVIVEVISPEDIGKLPDVSIAETLARLPGLTTQRINSRAQDIVVRGLTGDFSTALLNGRQQVSASGDRSVEFDQYPGELLNGVVVYKTTQPNLVGQGLAGTIDMRTVRPLAHGKRSFVANAFYEWTNLAQLNPDVDTHGNRFSFNYIDQNEDNTIGWAFGYSNTNRPGQGEQWNAWGFSPIDDDDNLIINGAKPFVRSSFLDRDSLLAVFEFRPNDRVHSTFDLFFSDFAEDQILRGIEFPLGTIWSTTKLEPGYTVEDGLITRATFTDLYGVMRNDITWRDADVFSPGWNLTIDNDNGWQFELDLSHSKINREDFVLETYSGWASNRGNSQGGTQADWSTPDTLVLMMGGRTGATFSSTLDYSSDKIRLASPQGWGSVPGGQLGFFKGPIAKDELNQAKTSLRRDLEGFFNEMEFGLAWTERSKLETNKTDEGAGWFLGLADGSWSAPFPPTIGFADLSFIGIGPQRAYDTRSVFESDIYELIPQTHPNNVSQNYDIEEEVTTAYAQFGIDTRLGSVPVIGTIGTQIIHSNQSSFGGVATRVGGEMIIGTATGSHTYTDLVPSLNLIFEIDDLNQLRFSLARQVARQEMDDMRASSAYNFNESMAGSTDVLFSPWSGQSGNPELEPWRSNSLDLSFEHYFADNMGYWALAGYYKDLISYTYIESLLSDFTGYPTGAPGVTPALFQGFRNKPQNGQGGHIYGLEFALTLPGEKLSEALEGFGVVLNASLTKSSISPSLGDPSQPIPGLSENIYNATVYYEKGGFEARTSGRYRSNYRGDIATFGFRGPNYRNILPESVFDAQVSYEYESGPLEGLTLILQGYNLTDEPLAATFGDQDLRLIQDYHRWGAQYSIGVSYKF